MGGVGRDNGPILRNSRFRIHTPMNRLKESKELREALMTMPAFQDETGVNKLTKIRARLYGVVF